MHTHYGSSSTIRSFVNQEIDFQKKGGVEKHQLFWFCVKGLAIAQAVKNTMCVF